jgi:hypothetical protein
VSACAYLDEVLSFPFLRSRVYVCTDIFLAIFVGVLFFCVMYCMKKVCPRVDMYSPLELDEIRLERAEDREGILSSKIDKMKVGETTTIVYIYMYTL